ncbi:hypothetical protein [Geodermatophilus sp. CPCC 206100]|uniref:hypothetical protein n=1 Tax=Geodermatophilus sp. CPCC 206100 TaxID=3020054 RepID=UPI003B00420B
MESAHLLRTTADRLEALAGRTTGGDWRTRGLLASRPEVVAHLPDGRTQHVAEARAGTGAWIAALSPALAGPLAAWLRAAADADPVDPAAIAVAEALLDRLPAGRAHAERPGPPVNPGLSAAADHCTRRDRSV